MMKKLRYKCYNKRITTRSNDNVQSHDQEKRELSITIIVNRGTHTLTDDKFIKSSFNKKNVATIKNK